ncbi:hypothetical protein EMIT0111MI5_110083 [Burkholderia sp. IT-111MI5]
MGHRRCNVTTSWHRIPIIEAWFPDAASSRHGRAKIVDGPPEPRFEPDRRLPVEVGACEADIGATLCRIILRQRTEYEPRRRARQAQNDLRKFADRDLVRIAEIDRAGEVRGRGHHPDQTVDHIVDIAERPGLAAVAIQRDVVAAQRLHDEVGNHAAVIGMHARPVRVEDAYHLDSHVLLAVIVEEQGLRATFSFVVAGARPERVDVAPVTLRLRMHIGVAVHFACRGLQNACVRALGEPQHVDRAHHTGLGGLHGIELIVDRRSRTGEVVDLVHLDVQRKGHVVAQCLEARVAEQRSHVLLGTGEIVVDAQYVVTEFDQTFAKMRTEETRAACYEDSLSITLHNGTPGIARKEATRGLHACSTGPRLRHGSREDAQASSFDGHGTAGTPIARIGPSCLQCA